jgi:hypothetical protein
MQLVQSKKAKFTWQNYFDGITKFIEANGSVFSAVGSGRLQQESQR